MASAPSSPAPAPPRPGVTVVVLGAGAGNRVGAGVNKVLIELAGRPLLAWSLTHALATTGVDRVVVVAAPTEHAEVADALVRHGLATRSGDRALRGSTVVSAVRREQEVPAPRPEVRGWCASTHHVEPVRAVVEGRRGRSHDDPWAEDVRLCGRCADLLGEAGFFTAA